ncbi:type I-E CRISPR-associated protein Cas5/CasD [Streptomyces scopuliridis]|uniref:Type I-E CRISPR-associated protein Cas5/CasD n=1 Tax=Streptomyces scopuliridis TaxID=452529 RepID=A0ACD4ZTA3_9ACTN|nr:type I-E CRISPR-associated protein Cas5/CasD [Streptomyces scopuliridis]WSC01695.1 type I-E CRISPR-associated protein Cas5/CasD [Streptomyces scopuliridis]WSC04766.1 type I-E CRISPR-associated protein Cas5/CasD [Streptomyces scopuliridis]
MPTLLLRLSGPLQSYGTTSHWEERSTSNRPTKSAVAGIIASALGLERDDDMSDFRALRFAVRADRPGSLMTDEQSAGGGDYSLPPLDAIRTGPRATDPLAWYGAPRAPEPGPHGTLTAPWHTENARTPVLITKQYLANAAFLAGFSTDDHQLAERLHAALAAPRRTLYLGRRTCIPAHPVAYGITPHSHDQWPHHIPLLPESTTPSPHVWWETLPAPGTTASPEQVPTTFLLRDYPLLHLRTHQVSPPPATPESTP